MGPCRFQGSISTMHHRRTASHRAHHSASSRPRRHVLGPLPPGLLPHPVPPVTASLLCASVHLSVLSHLGVKSYSSQLYLTDFASMSAFKVLLSPGVLPVTPLSPPKTTLSGREAAAKTLIRISDTQGQKLHFVAILYVSRAPAFSTWGFLEGTPRDRFPKLSKICQRTERNFPILFTLGVPVSFPLTPSKGMVWICLKQIRQSVTASVPSPGCGRRPAILKLLKKSHLLQNVVSGRKEWRTLQSRARRLSLSPPAPPPLSEKHLR